MSPHSTALFVGAALSLAACGGPNKVDSGERAKTVAALPIASSQETVAPMTVHQKQGAREAIILATESGARKIPLADTEQSVTVDVMWYRNSSPPVGGSSPTILTVNPQDDGAVRVGVFEQFQGGAGEMSRTSVWIAAFLASTVLGQDLTEYRFSAEVRGFVDGPSAGALVTAGYLAALTGASVDATATMTGTVNPDGTVGPVSGIPQKFAASIAQGKKRLGYPIGSRMANDAGTSKLVDLHELAARNGVLAVEVADVYDAYKLLTGKAMPRPTPLAASKMVVSSAVVEILGEKYAGWLKEYRVAEQSVIAANDVPKVITTLIKAAIEAARGASRSADNGEFVTAYRTILDAVVLIRTAAEALAITEDVRVGNSSNAQLRLSKRVDDADRAVAAMKKIGELHPDTIGGHLQMISSFQKGTAALGFAVWGGNQLRPATVKLALVDDSPAGATEATQKAAVEVAEVLIPGLLNLHRATVMATSAAESIDIESTQSSKYSCSEPAARQLAASYSSAAVANLRYFESILLVEIAKVVGGDKDRARQLLGQLDPDYVAATVAMKMSLGEIETTQALKEKWGEESLAWSLSSLGSSIMTYFKSSLLISRWYSLGVERDRVSGKTIKVTHKKAFANMLENAERSAREHAHAASVAIGEVPVQAQLEYTRGRLLRGGSLDDKLRSLESFWASSSYSQTAVVMARHVINPKKHGKAAR